MTCQDHMQETRLAYNTYSVMVTNYVLLWKMDSGIFNHVFRLTKKHYCSSFYSTGGSYQLIFEYFERNIMVTISQIESNQLSNKNKTTLCIFIEHSLFWQTLKAYFRPLCWFYKTDMVDLKSSMKFILLSWAEAMHE